MIENGCFCFPQDKKKEFQPYLDQEKNIKINLKQPNEGFANKVFLEVIFQLGDSQSGSKVQISHYKHAQTLKYKFSQKPQEIQILREMEKLRETILEKCIKGDINLIRVKDPLGKKNEFVIKTLYHELMQAMVSLTKDLSVCKKTINILIEGEFLRYKKDLKNINISIFRKEHYTVRDKEQKNQSIEGIETVSNSPMKKNIKKQK